MPKVAKLCYVVGYSLRKDVSGRPEMSDYAQRLTQFPTRLFQQVVMIGPEAGDDSSPDGRQMNTEPGNSSVCALPLPMPKSRALRWLKQLPALWRAVGGADLVCANIPEEASFLAAIACRLQRKPLLVQVIGDWREAVLVSGKPNVLGRLKARAAGWMASFTVHTAQLVFTQGRSLFEKYRVENPAAVKSAVVHTTLTRDIFFEQAERPFHEPLRLLSVSRLTPGKGLNLLIESIVALSHTGINVEWWVAGTGPERAALEELAIQRGVTGSICFFGFMEQDELLELYRKADIFVLPSFTEGIPNVMLEAMAQSLPVIVTAVGGIPSVLEDGVDALLIAPRSTEDIVNAVLRLTRDVSFTNRLRRAGFRTALKYQRDLFWQQHELLIESTFGRISRSDVQSNDVNGELLLER